MNNTLYKKHTTENMRTRVGTGGGAAAEPDTVGSASGDRPDVSGSVKKLNGIASMSVKKLKISTHNYV